MSSHLKREDISKFLVHLTRNSQGVNAIDNLVNMLNQKEIVARNFHCLFSPKIKKLNFSDLLKSKFKTVCFTETPLHQIKKLTGSIIGRRINLKPYGLVFWKDRLIEAGANPAIYINTKGSEIKTLLLSQFDSAFKDTRKWSDLKVQDDNHLELVQYFSLINIVSDRHNFLWEREWRHHSDFKFRYKDVVAIIAENSDELLAVCQRKMPEKQFKYVKKIPIIHPAWSYEEVIEQLSIQFWDAK